MAQPSERVRFLKSLAAVRETAKRVLLLADQDKLDHYTVDRSKVADVVSFVLEVAKENYPGRELTQIPYHSRWRHFEAGGVDRVAKHCTWPRPGDVPDVVRRMLDVAVVSVLLDAGAGATWKYLEEQTGQSFSRSEGLGVASWHMFLRGMFSSDPLHDPLRVDSAGLRKLTETDFRCAFQIDDQTNPLVGVAGRLDLLHNLADALEANPAFFQHSSDNLSRPGHMYDHLVALGREVHIRDLWSVVVDGFARVWPTSRSKLDGVSLGDAWPLPSLLRNFGPSEENGIACFHKLSQWMTYSLLEPLESTAGMTVVGASESMTGLAEYRNGGLLLDMQVIVPKGGAEQLATPHEVHDPEIIEWRSLTVALMDEVASELRKRVGGGLSADQLPLAKILEAGTWKAGRVVAKRLRPATGDPPIKIISDGTVF